MRTLIIALVALGAVGCAAVDHVDVGAGCSVYEIISGCNLRVGTRIEAPRDQNLPQPSQRSVSGESVKPAVLSVDDNSGFSGHTDEWVVEILTPAYDRLVEGIGYSPEYPVEVYLRPAGPTVQLVGGKWRIGLAVDGNYYMQYVYQFSHEMGHVLISVDDGSDWFEETLAQLASLYVIDSFAADPPWNGMFSSDQWMDYLGTVQQRYVDDRWNVYRIEESERVEQWLPRLKETLASDCCIRELSGGVAFELLPHFVERPELWQAAGSVNSDDAAASFIEQLLSRD